MSIPTVTLGTDGAAIPNVTTIGYGAMGLTAFYGAPLPDEESIKVIRAVYDSGVRHFDTAELYNTSFPGPVGAATKWNETVVGDALRAFPRDTFTVATKFFPGMHENKTDPETVVAAVEASLARLNLGHIDLYYVHRMPDGGKAALIDLLTSLKPLVAAKKIRAVGLSEVPPSWLKDAAATLPIAAVQQEWSILTRDLEEDVVPACRELGIAIVAYSPLCRSLLAAPKVDLPAGDMRVALFPRFAPENADINSRLATRVAEIAAAKGTTGAGVALKWLLQRGRDLGVTVVPIPGSRSVERAVANSAAAAVADLTLAEMEEINAMAGACAGARGSEYVMGHSYAAVGAKA